MNREITKIIDRLDELANCANELGQQRQSFRDHIKTAEAQLEEARKEAEEAERQKPANS